MHKVDFFIIGAQKAGTTSLYKYLDEHPDVFMPEIKENHFFCEEKFYNKGIDFFHKYYENYAEEQLIGGAYVHMLSSEEAPERVFKYNSNAKILIMLRNPVDRAYSAYNFAIQNGWESEKISFIEAIALQEKRLQGNFTEQTDLSYFYAGLYYKHISHWLHYFSRENVFILFDDDLKTNASDSLIKLFNFLDINTLADINTTKVHNKARGVKYKGLHFFIRNKESKAKQFIARLLPFGIRYKLRTRVRKFIDRINITEQKYTPLSFEDRLTAFEYFRQDIQALSSITQNDLINKWAPANLNK